ncbi:MAG: DUF86 domain-containing protein [Leptospiraceae bacterium]|nr:DUF86 domain-containing protein [Leptospiraceae bacterium]
MWIWNIKKKSRENICRIKKIKFRNLLVHEYVKIDKKEVYNVLQNYLNDIFKIQKMFIEKFL